MLNESEDLSESAFVWQWNYRYPRDPEMPSGALNLFETLRTLVFKWLRAMKQIDRTRSIFCLKRRWVKQTYQWTPNHTHMKQARSLHGHGMIQVCVIEFIFCLERPHHYMQQIHVQFLWLSGFAQNACASALQQRTWMFSSLPYRGF